jgi:hypothetical protein
MSFIKDFLSGKKKIIKATEIISFNVPRFEELTVAKVF